MTTKSEEIGAGYDALAEKKYADELFDELRGRAL
jgi:hypothetical protein